MKIVLVHGIFSSGRLFWWMRYRLQRLGFECFAPNIQPFDGRGGIERASHDLKDKIDAKYGDDEKLIIIGFSMGGIIVRHYLQELGGAQRCEAFISLATPHNGSYWAYMPYPTLGVKQLRPNSHFLNQLKASESKLDGVRLFSYWTPLDTSIVPSSSSDWPIANNKKFIIPLHLLVVFSGKIIKEIGAAFPTNPAR